MSLCLHLPKPMPWGRKNQQQQWTSCSTSPRTSKRLWQSLFGPLEQNHNFPIFPRIPHDLYGIMWTIWKLYITHHRSHPILRVHTQPKFVNHDGLAEGLLNHGHCTASGFLMPWKLHLTNSHGLLTTMISRMELDWISTAPKMRKAWNVKDLEP